MKKCNSCSFSNKDDSRFCAICGAKLTDDPFPAPNAEPTSAKGGADTKKDGVAKKSASAKKDNNKDNKSGAVSKCEKIVEFEKKNRIILNIIIMISAIVVSLVALLAPIPTMEYIVVPSGSVAGSSESDSYGTPISELVGENIYLEIDNDQGYVEYQYYYLETSQSLWKMFGALKYIKADEKDVEEFERQLKEIEISSRDEMFAWGQNRDTTLTALQNKYAEIYAEKLSDFNYLGYLLATSGTEKVEGYNISGNFYAAIITLVFGLIIAALAIAATVVSIVYFIRAIVNMSNKEPQAKPFKYFATVLGISSTALACMFAAPMFKAGGGMFAVALYISITYFICGLVGALFGKRDNVASIVKRAVTAVFAMVAFFLLCSNILNLVTTETNQYNNNKYVYSGEVPMGFSLFNVFRIWEDIVAITSKSSSKDAITPMMIYKISSAIVGLIMFLLIGFAEGYAFKAVSRSLRRLAYGGKVKNTSTSLMITSAVFALIAIVIGLAFSGGLTELFCKAFFGKFYETIERFTAEWVIRPQLWASGIILVVASIFNIAFNPINKKELEEFEG